MKKTKNQKGSAHLILTLFLGIALLGTIGYIFWQNLSKSDTSEKDSDKVSMKTLSFNPSAKSPITFSYPETWTVERVTTDGIDDIQTTNGSDNIKIYSPSKNTYVELNNSVTNKAFGYECGPFMSLSLESEQLPNYSGFSFYNKIDNENDSVRYESYLHKTLSEEEFEQSKSTGFCTAYSDNVIERVAAEGDANAIHSVWTARIKTSEDRSNLYSDLTEIDSIFESEEYKTAKAILLSATIE